MNMEYRYTPKYIRETLNYQAGDTVKHGDYNRSFNLLNVAVDNNTEALRKLMNDGGVASLNALALDDATLRRYREHVLEDNDEQVPSSKAVYQHVEEIKTNLTEQIERGLQGPQGPQGTQGADGEDGQGVPVGGTTGQVLKKKTNTDFDTEWGEAASVLVKATGSEVIAGTNDEKYVTPKAIKDGMMVSGDTLPIGSQVPFGSLTIPENWLLCDGRAISRVDYSELFAVIGTTYGAGNGSTTFNLPNKKGKSSVGYDGAQTEFNTIGKTGGAKTHTLTVDEMPSHKHDIIMRNTGTNSFYEPYPSYTATGDTTTINNPIQNTGGGQAHNNLQPYETDVWIIKARQSSGVVATVVDNLTSTSTVDALSANQGRVLDNVTKYITAAAGSNGDFNIDLGITPYTGMIVYVSFPSATTGTSDARLSLNNGTNYYNIKSKSNYNILSISIENSYIPLVFDGTNFVNIQPIKKLLWLNPNPGNSFAEQTITLATAYTNYDSITILFDNFAPYKNYEYLNTYSREWHAIFQAFSYNEGAGLITRNRFIVGTPNTSMTIRDAYENGVVDNTKCVPINIYGIID